MFKQITPFSNICKQFYHNKNRRRNDILKSTKCLIVSSKQYSDYTQHYLNTIHINSFKQPEIETYPVLKNHDLISLATKTYSFTSFSRQTFISASTSKEQMNTLASSSLLITEPRKTQHKHRVIESEPNLNMNLRIKHKKHLLRDILFNEPYYLNMVYDESLIFYKEAMYISYLKKKIEEFKYVKCTNLTSEVTRSFNNDSVLLKYQSMTLEFINLTDKTKKPIVFNFPFAYLPLFYLKDYDNIKYILLSVISFNETFDEITINSDEIYNFMKTSSTFNGNEASRITPAIDWNWNRLQTNCGENNDYSLLKKRDLYLSPRITVKANTKPNQQPNILSQYYNTIQKVWITPRYKYHMEIKMPIVTLTLTKSKKEIKKTIDAELAIFLLMNNFSKWDFYIANYLVSIKAFRWIAKQTLTKSKLCSNYKINDYLNQNLQEEILKQISIRSVKGFDYINLTKRKVKTPNEVDNTYHFYQTDYKLKNSYFILHNYSANIFSKLIKANKEFEFVFDLNQMKKLNAVSHYQSLKSFINKITVLNASTETISLHYEIFNDLNLESISKDDNTLKRFDDTDEVALRGLRITIIVPHLEKIDYVPHMTVQATSIVSDTNDTIHKVLIPEVLDDLCSNKISEWAEILCNFKDGSRQKTVSLNLNKETQRDKSLGSIRKSSNQKMNYKDSIML